MKYKIENCRYELVKDLLSSLDSLIANVEKDEQGTIVTLHEGNSQFDLMRALKQDPLQMFCENCKVYAAQTSSLDGVIFYRLCCKNMVFLKTNPIFSKCKSLQP